ncbi:HDOD domain-containing protein [Desulfosoma caldarium]|uniref:Putative nucleotidyltransferase with HDIG domain n=1 Tax=Desulfosoma caldarium TaxID=610254 RepID=A0A3N1VG41_9BACT|nr:HDOD domain-containing protein [Desulfosoma caldarium]ROR01804.1 putative nucleotidyltransferase with HDIG domain [Desulfosoma caldarium]
MVNLNEYATEKVTEKVLALVGEIPTFPRAVSHLMKQLKDPDTSLEDICATISGDPGLCVLVLRLANSPLYRPGFSNPTTLSIPRAVQMLGRKIIESAVLSYALRGMLRRSSLAEKLLWEHALACAVIASDIVRLIGSKNVETAYVCGLLHDVGKTVMCLRFPETMHAILEDQYNQSQGEDAAICSVAMEKEHLGIDHARVGAVCLNVWQCGEEAAVACAYHHRPKDVQGRSVWPGVIRIADILCHKMEYGPICRPMLNLGPVERALRINGAEMAQCLERWRAKIEETFQAFA